MFNKIKRLYISLFDKRKVSYNKIIYDFACSGCYNDLRYDCRIKLNSLSQRDNYGYRSIKKGCFKEYDKIDTFLETLRKPEMMFGITISYNDYTFGKKFCCLCQKESEYGYPFDGPVYIDFLGGSIKDCKVSMYLV